MFYSHAQIKHNESEFIICHQQKYNIMREKKLMSKTWENVVKKLR